MRQVAKVPPPKPEAIDSLIIDLIAMLPSHSPQDRCIILRTLASLKVCRHKIEPLQQTLFNAKDDLEEALRTQDANFQLACNGDLRSEILIQLAGVFHKIAQQSELLDEKIQYFNRSLKLKSVSGECVRTGADRAETYFSLGVAHAQLAKAGHDSATSHSEQFEILRKQIEALTSTKSLNMLAEAATHLGNTPQDKH